MPDKTPTQTKLAKMERDNSPWTELYQAEEQPAQPTNPDMQSAAPAGSSTNAPRPSANQADKDAQDALTKAFNW
ncbi:MAG TPA: hypothetical protein PLD47_15735 [Aggregatilineales bacterium]|nr:hypothetical protein [Anaerolineales bacterium]HRE49180.1 hypothetical protein [Aggregatilineales bacterium]